MRVSAAPPVHPTFFIQARGNHCNERDAIRSAEVCHAAISPGSPAMYRGLSFRWICLVATFIIFVFAPCPLGAQVCTNDQQGPDDQPGQKDLTRFCDGSQACTTTGVPPVAGVS